MDISTGTSYVEYHVCDCKCKTCSQYATNCETCDDKNTRWIADTSTHANHVTDYVRCDLEFQRRIFVTTAVNVVSELMTTLVHHVGLVHTCMEVNVLKSVQMDIMPLLQELVKNVMVTVKLVMELMQTIVTLVMKEHTSIYAHVLNHAQMETLKKNHQFNNVLLVTPDVLIVKTPPTPTVPNVSTPMFLWIPPVPNALNAKNNKAITVTPM